MECIIFVLFFSINNTIFILFHENCDNFLKNWPFSPRFCPVIAKKSPTGRIHKPGDFWEKQPLTGRSPGVPGEIAGLKFHHCANLCQDRTCNIRTTEVAPKLAHPPLLP